MTRLDLIALLIAAFLIGAYAALVARALVASRAHDRLNDAAVAALSPDALGRLREYIAEIDEHERQRIVLSRDGGSTTVFFP